jgi:hypothetical protein
MIEYQGNVVARIIRTQFTRYDAEDLHPECNNAEYLEYKKSSISSDIISYGYKVEVFWGKNHCRYWWLPIEAAKGMLEFARQQE